MKVSTFLMERLVVSLFLCLIAKSSKKGFMKLMTRVLVDLGVLHFGLLYLATCGYM